MALHQININLAGPRGFCAGVDRAILMVEEAIKKFGRILSMSDTK